MTFYHGLLDMLGPTSMRHRTRCFVRRLATWAAVWSLVGPIASASGTVELLRQVGTQSAPADMVGQLARQDLAELFAILEVGSLPLPGIRSEDAAFGTRVATALSETQRVYLLAAIAATPPARLRGFLAANVTPEHGHGTKRAALRVLAPIAGAQDLGPAIDLMKGSLPRLAPDFAAWVAQALANDPKAWKRVKEELDTDDADLRAALIRGLGATGARPGLLMLNGLLFDDDPHLEVLLGEIELLARSLVPPHDEVVLDSVRRFLSSEAPPIAAAAVRAAGALADTRAVPELIALLDHDSSGVHAAAKAALIEVTGLRFATSRRWFLWYASEREWWDARWPALAPELRSATRENITSLLAETIGKRLERDWLADEIVGLLQHDDALVRQLACQSLGQLEARSVLPDLLAAMGDPDDAVARSAWNAMRSATRRDLPFDPLAWSQLLEETTNR